MTESTVEFLRVAVIGFLSIGLEEALIKPIAKSFFKRKILKYAPVAMNFLDRELAGMLSGKNGSQIESALVERLEGLTGESWKKQEIDELFLLYDPRITASKNLP